MYSFPFHGKTINIHSEHHVEIDGVVFDTLQAAIAFATPPALTPGQKELLLLFLDDLKNQYSDAGCNDFIIPATPNYVKIAKELQKADPDSCSIQDGKIYSLDLCWLIYIQDVIKHL